MPYFAVDDGMYDHPKFDMVSDAAVALWVKAGSFCSKYLTDGYIHIGRIVRIGYSEGTAEELVHAGLWERVLDGEDGGFRFHQWAEHQQIKAEVEKQRHRWRETKRSKRAAELLKNAGLSTVDSARASHCPIPSHPNPVREESVQAAKPARTRAPSVALDALKAALKAKVPMAPVLSRGNAEKVSARLKEAVSAGLAPDVGSAAAALVDACVASGKDFPWCLLDVNPYVAAKRKPPDRADREGALAELRAAYGLAEASLAMSRASGDRDKERAAEGRLDALRSEMRAVKASAEGRV